MCNASMTKASPPQSPMHLWGAHGYAYLMEFRGHGALKLPRSFTTTRRSPQPLSTRVMVS
jgi:hypothetical protein